MTDDKPQLPSDLGPEDSIVDLLHQLDELGYVEQLTLTRGECSCHSLPGPLRVEDLEVDRLYRTEGESNPDDQTLVAALRAPAHDWKGVLVTGFGPSVPEEDAEFLRRLAAVG